MKFLRYMMWIAATILVVLGATGAWMTVELCQPPIELSSLAYDGVKGTRLYTFEDVTLTQVYHVDEGKRLYAAGYTYDREQAPMTVSLQVTADSPLYDTLLALPKEKTLTVSGYVLHRGQLSETLIDTSYTTPALTISRSFGEDVTAHITLYNFEYICDITEDPSAFTKELAAGLIVWTVVLLTVGAVLIVVSIILLKRDKSHLMRGAKDLAKRGQGARKAMNKSKK